MISCVAAGLLLRLLLNCLRVRIIMMVAAICGSISISLQKLIGMECLSDNLQISLMGRI